MSRALLKTTRMKRDVVCAVVPLSKEANVQSDAVRPLGHSAPFLKATMSTPIFRPLEKGAYIR